MSDDPEAALAAYDVSRETRDRLEQLVAELRRWQAVKNLVGPETLGEVWHRHVADSLQLHALAPDARTWLDLGSGAGFPGLVLGIVLADKGGVVHLVESNGRKCAFLRHAARVTRAAVQVHDARLETVIDGFVGRVEVVTARALAALPQLLVWTQPLLRTGTIGLFPKGQDALAELTEARKSMRFDVDATPSRTDPRASILRIRWLEGSA